MFLINIEPGRQAYRYDVDIMNITRQKSLARGADEYVIFTFDIFKSIFSGQRSLNRNICYELLTSAYAKTNGLGMEHGSEVIYDCKTTMYTSKSISLSNVGFFIKSYTIT